MSDTITKPVSKMLKAELVSYLGDRKVTFDANATVPQLKEIALPIEHLEEVKASLTERAIDFTEENTIEELEALLNGALVTEAREKLATLGVQFTEENTLEELQELITKAEAPKEESDDSSSKAEDGFVMVRNETSRTINGIKPYQISVIKEENLETYLSYGVVVYDGKQKAEAVEEKKDADGNSDTPPHLRK
jgi:hypothetical protein